MTSSPGQWAEIVAQSFVVFQAGIWSCRGLDRLPSVSGAQVRARRPQIIEDMAEQVQGISLVNFCLFCHNFWTRNARKSIKPSEDSYCNLESKKNFESQNLMDCWTPRVWRHYPNVNKYAYTSSDYVNINIKPEISSWNFYFQSKRLVFKSLLFRHSKFYTVMILTTFFVLVQNFLLCEGIQTSQTEMYFSIMIWHLSRQKSW